MVGTRVAVTGGSGYVGAAVCAALTERGCTVAALSRSTGRGMDGVRMIGGGLTDPAALDELVADAQVVVNAAGLVRASDVNALRAANVDGLTALLERCRGVERLVHISTAGVHGLPGGSVDESSPFRPDNRYEASKAEAERVLFTARPSGTVVIRPTNILGRGHPLDPLQRFLAAVVSGHLWTWSGAWANYVGLDAVAAAVSATVVHPDPPRVLILNDPRPIAGLAALSAQLLAVPDRTHLLPPMAARAARQVVIALRGSRPLQRVRSALETTRFETQHDSWLEQADVRVDLEATLSSMIEDYRGRGLL